MQQNMSLGPMVFIGCIRSEKFQRDFVAQTFALIAPDWPICAEFNAEQKHEFRVPWCDSRAFVVKSSDATSWHELLH